MKSFEGLRTKFMDFGEEIEDKDCTRSDTFRPSRLHAKFVVATGVVVGSV